MTFKNIKSGVDARNKIMEGIDILANTVRTTMGPRGRTVLIEKQWGGPHITKDGVSVAKEINLVDPYQNMGAQLIKQVASKTAETAGDGTTTATVLAQAIAQEGVKAVAAGLNPMDIKRGIDMAVSAVVANIQLHSREVIGKEEIAQVGTISANGDKEIGNKIAEAMDKVGFNGVITVEEAKGLQFEVDVVEGMNFDKGYLSPFFITNTDKSKVEYSNPLILLVERKISTLKSIVPVLEQAMQLQKPLLIIAEDVENEALTGLVVNKVKAGLRVVAVKSPGYGVTRTDMLSDIAVLTGAKVVSEDLGDTLEDVDASWLGTSTRVVITRDSTTIIGGEGSEESIQERVLQIQNQIPTTENEYDQLRLKERLASLVGGVAVLKVGGSTEVEVKERKDRVDDALNATRAAVEEGIVPGGGSTLLFASRVLDSLVAENDDQRAGINIIRKALQAPVRQIAINAGIDGAIVVGKLMDANHINFGFDAQNLSYVTDMMASGIIDPTKVVRCALQDAASVSSLLITTEAVIVDVVEDKPKPQQGF